MEYSCTVRNDEGKDFRETCEVFYKLTQTEQNQENSFYNDKMVKANTFERIKSSYRCHDQA